MLSVSVCRNPSHGHELAQVHASAQCSSHLHSARLCYVPLQSSVGPRRSRRLLCMMRSLVLIHWDLLYVTKSGMDLD